MAAEFAGTLRQRVTIEAPAPLRRQDGLAVGGWIVVAEVRADVVPMGLADPAEAMALSASPKFRVTIRARDDVAVGQRLRWRDRLLAVRGVTRDPRLADRLTMVAEEVSR